jgi:YidC/Oxa1 family membrane protein insertase
MLSASLVTFPTTGGGTFGINGPIYGLLRWLFGFLGDYGITIVLFTLILRLIMLPLDFGSKYFTKRNALKQAELKPEDDKLKQIYGNDPIALNRARQELYRKQGYGQGGFCLFMILNIAVMLIVFLAVFSCLREVSNFNLNRQYIELQKVYQSAEYSKNADGTIAEADRAAFHAEVNKRYNETRVGFLWVHNIWQPDTWAAKTLTYEAFVGTTRQTQHYVFADDNREDVFKRAEYDSIFGSVNTENSGWNGWLILVLLAGVSTYLTALLNTRMMKSKKKKEAAAGAEVTPQYSLRTAKEQYATASGTDPSQQMMNPAAMGGVMKFVLPLVMVIFTVTSTAALAIYIIVNSVMTTLFGVLTGWVADKILAGKKKDKDSGEVIINPHSKYFKKAKHN